MSGFIGHLIRKLRGPDHKLSLVSWWYGKKMMELSKVELEEDLTVNDSQNNERKKMQFVNIGLHTLDSGR
jgi:hypothetical protein